jgi:hypothetical protein
VWDRGYLLSPEIGLLLADALGLYALALGLRRPIGGGAWLGLAIGIAFLCRGPIAAAIIALTAVALPLFAAWRRRLPSGYGRDIWLGYIGLQLGAIVPQIDDLRVGLNEQRKCMVPLGLQRLYLLPKRPVAFALC